MRRLACLVIITIGVFVFGGCSAGRYEKTRETTLLHEAAALGDVAKIESLLKSDLSPNITNDIKQTPLMLACLLHSGEKAVVIINIFIEFGADVNAQDANGFYVIDYAKRDIRGYLRSVGAKDGIISELHFAALAHDENRIPELVDSGIDVNIEDNYGRKPIHYAVESLMTEKFQKTKMRTNKKDSMTYNFAKWISEAPLDVEKAKSTIKVLARLGADLNAQLLSGDTPLHIAANYENKEVSRLLVSLGADPNLKDMFGKKPDDYFAMYTRIDAEMARQEGEEAERLRRQRQNNDQLTAALFGVAMGVAMDNSGASSGESLQAGLAMYQDVSNDTTSNTQSLIDQYNQKSPLGGQTNPTSQKAKGCAGGISGTWKASGGKTTMTLHSNGQAELTNDDSTGQYRVEATFSWNATADSFSTSYDTFKMVNIRTGKVEGRDTPRPSSASCSYSGNTLSIGGTSYSR